MKYLYLKIVFLFAIAACYSQKNYERSDIKFAHLTDLHVSVGNDNDFLLQQIIKEINSSKNEFVVITGDLTNRGDDDELNRVHAILTDLKIPYYVISGNHETTWSESAGLTYKKLWGNDRFAFSKGDYLFVGFPCGPYMKMGDGFVKKEDLLFLDKTLKDSLNNSAKKVLSFSHYPLDNSLSNYKEVLSILQKYPTVASFCGHGHTLKKYDFSGLSGVMGVAIVTRDGKTKSYNEVEISNDSIRIYQKEIDKQKAFRFSVPSQPSKIKIENENGFDKIVPFITDIASIYSVPAAVASVPISGQSCTSDLETKRQWRAACSTGMSSQEIWLDTSSTGPVMGGWPRISSAMPAWPRNDSAQAWTCALCCDGCIRGRRTAAIHKPHRM